MNQPTDLPFIFGGLEPQQSAFENARVLIWPVPYERTVSYGLGTREGPEAIIDASRYMELYDEEIGGETAAIGIHTLPAMEADREPDEMIPALEQRDAKPAADRKVPVHAGRRAFHYRAGGAGVSAKSIPNFRCSRSMPTPICETATKEQSLSHAAAMRRVLEVCPAVQVGIRSLSTEEARAIPQLPTRIFWAKDIAGRTDWVESAVDALTDDVYLTIDIDGLDPSLVPSTGTPEPGGLMWYEVLALLRTLARKRRVVGMDLVELCKSPIGNGPSFLAAKLIYKTLGYIFREHVPRID